MHTENKHNYCTALGEHEVLSWEGELAHTVCTVYKEYNYKLHLGVGGWGSAAVPMQARGTHPPGVRA